MPGIRQPARALVPAIEPPLPDSTRSPRATTPTYTIGVPPTSMLLRSTAFPTLPDSLALATWRIASTARGLGQDATMGQRYAGPLCARRMDQFDNHWQRTCRGSSPGPRAVGIPRFSNSLRLLDLHHVQPGFICAGDRDGYGQAAPWPRESTRRRQRARRPAFPGMRNSHRFLLSYQVIWCFDSTQALYRKLIYCRMSDTGTSTYRDPRKAVATWVQIVISCFGRNGRVMISTMKSNPWGAIASDIGGDAVSSLIRIYWSINGFPMR